MRLRLRLKVLHLPWISTFSFSLQEILTDRQKLLLLSPLSQYQWLSNFAGWILILRDSYPYSCMTLWSCGLAESWQPEKFITLLRQWQWLPNLAGWLNTLRHSYPYRVPRPWQINFSVMYVLQYLYVNVLPY